jgi:hypothetical protein
LTDAGFTAVPVKPPNGEMPFPFMARPSART